MRSAIFIIACLLVFTLSGYSKTINVPGDFNAIQDAIDAAVHGDTVVVHPDKYVENIDFKGKSITVKGDQGPDVTVIDGNQAGSVVAFHRGEDLSSVLNGFTLTNGSGTPSSVYNNGGGIYCSNGSSPTITNNTISGNVAENGGGGGIYCEFSSSPEITNNTISGNDATYGSGGISCWEASPTITDNTISRNSTTFYGGGIECYKASPAITNNTISRNSVSYYGGGIYCHQGSPTIAHNTITENKTDSGLNHGGGGIHCHQGSPTITNNIITANTAFLGGGIYCFNASPAITGNTISGNSTHSGSSTDNKGGGIYCREGSAPAITANIITENTGFWGGGIYCELYSNPAIENNLITENMAAWAGGICCEISSSSKIMNTTISGNEAAYGGGGIACSKSSTTEITNSILWYNQASSIGPEILISTENNPSTVTISHSNVDGGKSSVYVDYNCTLNWGAGMIDSDPLFVDPAIGDFHLTFPSPCRDIGDNSAITELYDFEGDPRIAYGTVDMGADEFYTHLYWTGDATPGGNIQLKFVDLPGTAPVGFCIGSGVLDPPLKSMWGDWYLAFPIIGPVSMPSIPSTGVLIVPKNISASPPPPYSVPMQALIGVELTNLCVLVVE